MCKHCKGPHGTTRYTARDHTEPQSTLQGTTRNHKVHCKGPHGTTRYTARDHTEPQGTLQGTTRNHKVHCKGPHGTTRYTARDHTEPQGTLQGTTRNHKLHCIVLSGINYPINMCGQGLGRFGKAVERGEVGLWCSG